jgi:EamA domain-containing membrane protein RarD
MRPVRLIVAHKILISAALVLAVILLTRGIRLYLQTGASAELSMGLAFGAVGVVLALYLRYIWPK